MLQSNEFSLISEQKLWLKTLLWAEREKKKKRKKKEKEKEKEFPGL